MKPFISIIIPVYNTEKYLTQCIESVLAQTYTHYEILLIDDESPDQAGKLCDSYSEKYEHIKTVHKKNGGLISAWTEGVKHSRGEYLCFLDSDDWIDSGMLSDMAAKIDMHYNRQIISGNYVIERENGAEKKSSAGKPGEYTGCRLEQEIKEKVLGEEDRTIILSRCMKLISRSLITENIKFCNEKIRMGEDVNIMLPAILDADRIYLMEEGYYYHYRFVNSSMAHGYDRALVENLELLYQVMKEILIEKGIPKTDMAEREFLLLLFLEIKNELRGNRRNAYVQLRRLFLSEKIRCIVEENPLQINGLLNKLLYLVERKPNRITIGMLQMLFDLQKKLG